MTPALLALALVTAAPTTKDKDAKKEPPSIVGEWVAEKAVLAGNPRPAPDGGVTMEFKADGKVVIKEGTKGPIEATYTTDPKKEPAEFEMTPPIKGPKNDSLIGIYKVEGDTLTLCLAPDGQRPAKFESSADVPTMLMTFKRAKKKD
jgi:uncharacterized protein (TIGR03067 family)